MNEWFYINIVAPNILSARLGIPLKEADELVKNSLTDKYKDLWWGDEDD